MRMQRLQRLEQHVRHLITQGTRDPQVLSSLREIQENLRGVPRAGRQALVYARIQYDLGVAFADWPAGDPVANTQRAIACFEEALRYLSQETAPLAYVDAQNTLGDLYASVPIGQRDVHLRRAIACYEEALRCWTTETDQLVCAATWNNLGEAYRQLPTGDQGINLQQAIACYEQALRLWTLETDTFAYAATQNNLGIAYTQLPTAERAMNVQEAIAHYHEALRFWTLEGDPLAYATVQNNLGNAYNSLLTGDRATNVEQAIACYEEALRGWTPEAAPLQYATVQNNLGNVYGDLPTGDRTINLQRAIACYEAALCIWTPEAAPLAYASAQNNLGIAYSDLPTGDRTINLQRAIACYEEALRIWTSEAAPLDYASAQNNLGLASADLPTGDRTINLQRAIVCYEEALRFRTPEAAPLAYATTRNNLGNAYSTLPTGERAAHLQQAIACYQEALRFRTPEVAPLAYAETQQNLGTVYADLPTGERTINLQRAIACYEEALRFRTPEAVPLAYATTRNNLGIAYQELPAGDRHANVQEAITCYEEALRFWTLEAAPHRYAAVQQNLGNAYSDVRGGDRTVQQAIACYQEALLVWTPETAPLEYASVQNNLGGVYAHLTSGDRAATLGQAIICYKEALRFWTAESDPLHYATAQNNLGEAYKRWPTDDPTILRQAIACFQEALRFWTAESDPPGYATAQHNLGGVYAHLTSGDHTATLGQAIACYEAALRVRTAESAPEECRRSAQQLANLFFKQHAWSRALEAFQGAIGAGEVLYRADLSAESKTSEMAANAELYRHAAYAAVQCGQHASALELLEQGKTRVLSEALRIHLLRPATVPEGDWAAYQEAAAAVRSLQATNLLPLARAQDRSRMYALRVQAAHEAAKALEHAIERVRRSAPAFLRTIDLAAARALLPNEVTCFVLFCITTQGSLGLLVTRAEPEVRTVVIPDFTHADLLRLLLGEQGSERPGGWLSAYTRYLTDPTPHAREVWQHTMEQVLADLGRRLLDPVLSAVPGDIEHLVFLPSAQLFLFPLHAVPLAGERGERVCDRYRVSYTPSLEVLADTQAKAAQEVPPTLYALLNPQADPRLAFASREGTTLTALFPHSTCDEGRTGTRQRVISGVRGRTYLHFACHGRYNWDDPAASGLELADGRLTLAELEEGCLDLSAARVVTLSACETGLTDVIGGSAEEYVGVPAGFLLAGVPSVVGSLWRVPDLATLLLMERLYQSHLHGRMGLPAALHEAQRWVRTVGIDAVVAYVSQAYEQSGRTDATLLQHLRHYRALARQDPDGRPFAHPSSWAAFTVNGW